ncbi:MAG: cytochrome c nitrite reductase small subunit [Acidobacteria bacterium]|nr:cytochrome c nitrite reductase small subunit [Acidobacteriota bacterium]
MTKVTRGTSARMRFPGVAIAGLTLSIAVGLAAGVGGYTFVFARGASYLTDDPAACANCHIMNEYYDGWLKSSHRSVAVCNDCHTPSGLISKYTTKAYNGFWHSVAFTTGRFPEPLRIKPHNYAIAEQACHKCHQAMVEAIGGFHADSNQVPCIRCHNEVGHP